MQRKRVNSELIAKNDTTRFGRATLVTLTSNNGVKAYGLSVKSNEDRENSEIGYNVARSRAETSLALKLQGRKVKHRFMW